ncbi:MULTISPECIES: J domain-containing protein [unclassified Haladaptatus]|uniref:J domain-containing protein n=1 Tax=unclassified Haladaptatus TaxID=2622732 RepID=UPI0023E7E671|nr:MULTISPECIES: J domain-containing protein [unclassified Haladaptatus]
MTQSRLLIGLVSVFAGMTVLFLVLSFVFSPAMLVAAALFGATTYLLWFHASGKLQEQVHRQANAARRPPRQERGGFGAGPRQQWQGPRQGRRQGAQTRGRVGRPPSRNQQSLADAYRVLGLEPGADEASVKQAYRKRVKETHPDTERGSEEAFKRVTAAYERLSKN